MNANYNPVVKNGKFTPAYLLRLKAPTFTTEDSDTENKLVFDYRIQTVGCDYPTLEVRGHLL